MNFLGIVLLASVASILTIPAVWFALVAIPVLAVVVGPVLLVGYSVNLLSRKPRLQTVVRNDWPNIRLYLKGVSLPQQLAQHFLAMLVFSCGAYDFPDEAHGMILKREEKYHLIVRSVRNQKCEILHYSAPRISDLKMSLNRVA